MTARRVVARWGRFVVAVVGSWAAAAISCLPRGEAARRDASSVTILYPHGDERVLGLQWDDPAKFLVFLPLVAANERGEPEGRLARSWQSSPDYRTWTIRLRSDVRWHDGEPVTAHDIKFTMELLSRPEVALSSGAATVTVLDDTTYTAREAC